MSIREPKLPRRTLKGTRSFEEVSIWGSQVDESLRDIVISFGDVARAINALTVQTPSAIITPHAAQHLPLGTDPLGTGVPVSIASANAIGGANSFSNSAHVHQGVHSLDAGGVDLYGDITFAASGTGLTVGQSGQTITYTLASGLDAGTLDGMDSTELVWTNGLNPLTNAWDAGNFAITLGSIVGKSGDLSIAPASGGNISFGSSIASGSSNIAWQFTDTVARTAGSYFRITDSGAINRFVINAPAAGASLLTVATNSADSYNNILQFAATVTTAANVVCTGVANTVSQGGTAGGGARGLLISASTTATKSNPAIHQSKVYGLDVYNVGYTSASAWGNNANDRHIGAFIGLSYADNDAVAASYNASARSGGIVIDTTGTTGYPLPQWAGVICDAPPLDDASAGPLVHVGFAYNPPTVGGTQAGDAFACGPGGRMVFDSTVSCSGAASGSSTVGSFSYTSGDTYIGYNSGSTQLDLYVDAAQAFHFDAGGAAGTSRCYGNFLGDGTVTSTGTLAATNAATVGTTLQVTGIATFLTHARWGDSDKIHMGDAQDAAIYWDASNLIIDPTEGSGSGYVLIEGGGGGIIGRRDAGAFLIYSGSTRATTGTHHAFYDVGGTNQLLTIATSGISGVNTDIDHGVASSPLRIGPTVATTITIGRSGQQVTCASNFAHTGTTVGLYSATPVAQAADIVALTDSSGGTANSTIQALTDPADTPLTAAALRDDLVANLIPELRNNFADLAAKVNAIRTVISAAAGGVGITA